MTSILKLFNKNNFEKNSKTNLYELKRELQGKSINEMIQNDLGDITAPNSEASPLKENINQKTVEEARKKKGILNIVAQVNGLKDLTGTQGDSRMVTFRKRSGGFEKVGNGGNYDATQNNNPTITNLGFYSKEMKINTHKFIYGVTDDLKEDSLVDIEKMIEDSISSEYNRTVDGEFYKGILDDNFIGADDTAVAELSALKTQEIQKNLYRIGQVQDDLDALTLSMDRQTYTYLQTLDEFIAQNKYGQDATNTTGKLEKFCGIKIKVVDGPMFREAKANGKKLTTADNTDDKKYKLLVLTNDYNTIVGMKRDLTIEEQREAANQRTLIVASARFGVVSRDNYKDDASADKTAVYFTLQKTKLTTP